MIMSLTTLRSVLLYCTIINYGFLALWGLLIMLPHSWMHRLYCKRLNLSAEQFDTVSYGGVLLYKILIFMFNLVPYIALTIVGTSPQRSSAENRSIRMSATVHLYRRPAVCYARVRCFAMRVCAEC